MSKRCNKFAALLLFANILFSNVYAGEYRVWPLVVDLDATPGETHPFSFNVLAVKSGRIQIYHNELKQLPTGHIEFIPSKSSAYLKLDKKKVLIDQGKTLVVNGEFYVPRKTSGSKQFAIIVEDDSSRSQSVNGLEIKVRYAVTVNVKFDGKNKKIKAKFTSVQINDGVVNTWFENLSGYKGDLKSEIQIRDENRRLVMRSDLRTLSAIERGVDYSVVYPNSKVRVLGE